MDSFQFNKQWFNAIRILKTPEARDKVFMAICELAINGQLSEDNAIHTASTARGIFQMIEQEIIDNAQSIDNKRNAQSNGGKKSAKKRGAQPQTDSPELPLEPPEPPSEVDASNFKLLQVTSTRARAHTPFIDDNNLYVDDKGNNSIIEGSKDNIVNTREEKKAWVAIVERWIKEYRLEPARDKLMQWYEMLDSLPGQQNKLINVSISNALKTLAKETQLNYELIDLILQDTLSNGWVTITADRIKEAISKKNGKTATANFGNNKSSRSDQLAGQTASIIGSLAECAYPQVQPAMDVGGGNLFDNG